MGTDNLTKVGVAGDVRVLISADTHRDFKHLIHVQYPHTVHGCDCQTSCLMWILMLLYIYSTELLVHINILCASSALFSRYVLRSMSEFSIGMWFLPILSFSRA